MACYEVIVSNIGKVHEGDHENKARQEFNEYVVISKAGRGRVGGESVDLYCDGEPIKEYIGKVQRDEMKTAL